MGQTPEVNSARRPVQTGGEPTVLRRQTAVRRLMPGGSSRDERLDPFSLPLRFCVGDATADERVRAVVLTRERVVLRRSVAGMLMALNLPVKSYLGVALRIEPPRGEGEGAVELPLLIAEADGRLRGPFARIGTLKVRAAAPRRRARATIKLRRPSIFLRRKAGGSLGG